jgi:DNA polymerase III psi subunit
MSNQLTNNPEALRLFFTEDIFLVKEQEMPLALLQNEHQLPLADAADEDINSQTENQSETSAAAADTIDITGLQTENQPTTSVPVRDTVENMGLESKNQETSFISAVDTVDNTVLKTVQIEDQIKTSASAVIDFQYIGANERNILILVNDAMYPVSSLQGRELLGKILKAIKLDRNDCALVNYAAYDGARFQQLQEFFNPQYVFAFGVSPEQLKLPALSSNTIVVQNGANLIFSSNLDTLSEDMNTKKLLWASLQQIKLR